MSNVRALKKKVIHTDTARWLAQESRTQIPRLSHEQQEQLLEIFEVFRPQPNEISPFERQFLNDMMRAFQLWGDFTSCSEKQAEVISNVYRKARRIYRLQQIKPL